MVKHNIDLTQDHDIVKLVKNIKFNGNTLSFTEGLDFNLKKNNMS